MPEAVSSAPAAAPSSGSSSAGSGSLPGGGTSTPGAGSPPPASSAPAPGSPPAPPARQKWKDTVDGKEVEFEADEAELRHAYRKSKGADLRFEQAAQMRKEAAQLQRAREQLQQNLKKDPKAVLEFLREQGVEDPLDYVANALQAKLAEEEQLQDPNVRARVEAERKLQTFEEQRQKEQQELHDQQFNQTVQEETVQIVEVFDKALALVDLPADDDTLAIMAQLESENRRRGLNITPERLAQATQERVMTRGMKAISAALTSGRVTGEKLLAMDPALTKAFNKALIDDWKKRQGKPVEPAVRPQSTGTRPAVPDIKPGMSDKEAWEKLEKEKGTRLLRTI